MSRVTDQLTHKMTEKLSFKVSNLKLLVQLYFISYLAQKNQNKSDNANARKVRFRTGIRVHCKAFDPTSTKRRQSCSREKTCSVCNTSSVTHSLIRHYRVLL
ncbi:hypothetical protein TNCT_173521 [Trichonephila clavata]|uniref:Uncharacterized protein n=1 Tax=Trichonephila clavata TaxID=2740835 RepID=A0A8X6HNR9_TRICU|nr:hypothetical protein TNCT_173521 [Trichonephila clavata]